MPGAGTVHDISERGMREDMRREPCADENLAVAGTHTGDRTIHVWRTLAEKTLLWLKNLPELTATDNVEPTGLWVGATSSRKKNKNYFMTSNRDSKKRAKTFKGVAEAMAEQWGGLGEE